MKSKVPVGILLAGSLVFNAVFIGAWIAHALPRHLSAQGQRGPEEACHRQCAMQKTLLMSDSQWTMLKPGVESLRGKSAALCHEIARNRAALVDELEKAVPDSAAVALCTERILAGQREMQALITGHILEEKKMLTQDQSKRYFTKLRGSMSCAGFSGSTDMAACGRGNEIIPKGKCERAADSSNHGK
jgi:hypothetical protein